MAEIIRINIDASPNRERFLTIPEIIEVPKLSVVQWNIINFEENLYNKNRHFRSLIFTLYFDNKSPFGWKRKFIQLHRLDYGPIYSKTLRLAEDVAEKKGDFKYGISVVDAEQNEPIFDEDPLLRVF